jgi:predicted short-subunit dehydrogenase-like oxidoreductase (DUF2520 family)
MRVVFIGSGNVATVLARLLKEAGHTIAGIYSHTLTNAGSLARELDVQKFGLVNDIIKNADVYIIAVSDNVIIELGKTLRLPGKIVLHTSGSTPQSLLKPISDYHGVLYPLKSLRKQAQHQPVIPLLINASDNIVKEQVRALAESISFVVEEANDAQRLRLHLAAVMVSNFTNYLYALADDYCTKEHVPFKTLVPLIKEVAERTALYNPADMQTGPAIRGDSVTIDKHLQLLAAYPLQQQVYAELTKSILQFYGGKEQ